MINANRTNALPKIVQARKLKDLFHLIPLKMNKLV